MTNRRRAGLSLALSVLTACSGGGPGGSRQSADRDTLQDGTVVVRYGVLPAGGVALAPVDLRLGMVEGDPNFMFGDVRGVEAGRDGTIYVLD
jgi:hypothetical protein